MPSSRRHRATTLVEVVDRRAGPLGAVAEHADRVGRALLLGRSPPRRGGRAARRRAPARRRRRAPAGSWPARGRRASSRTMRVDDLAPSRSSTCSQLSTTSSIERTLERLDDAVAVGHPGRVARRRACRGTPPRPPRRVGDPAEVDEPASRARAPARTRSASRVLPTPPGPASVTSRDRVDGAVEAREVVVAADERVGRLRQVPGASARPAREARARAHRRRAVPSVATAQHRPRARDALQRVAAPLDELDAGAGDQVAHRRRSRAPRRARRARPGAPRSRRRARRRRRRATRSRSRAPRRGCAMPELGQALPSPRARRAARGPAPRTPRARRRRWT